MSHSMSSTLPAPVPSRNSVARGVVLIVDDDPQIRRTVSRVLRSLDIETIEFETAEQALSAVDDATVALALIDVMLPGMSGLELLDAIRQHRPDVEAVMMTGSMSIENAVRAMKNGAYDYLQKPFESVEKLGGVVRNALERRALIRRNVELEQLLDGKEVTEIVGCSPVMQPVFETIRAVADTPATVLITGENGTGKELVARALHRLSSRSRRTFVPVNCSSFSEGVLESELFGHVKGAFTGAASARKGVFETADKGTIFLDEIGDISPRTQVSLLRVLQEGEIKRVGASEPTKVDVRVIAATNVDLREAVRRGALREDLFYRLNVINIHLPPLRERRTDIPLIAMHLLRKHAERMNRTIEGISEGALEAMCGHDWPGNVRELENCIARAVVLCKNQIEEKDLPRELTMAGRVVTDAEAWIDKLPYAEAKRRTVETFERRYLRAKLKAANGNISRAAELAGMDRSNFKRLCRSCNVEVRDDNDSGLINVRVVAGQEGRQA